MAELGFESREVGFKYCSLHQADFCLFRGRWCLKQCVGFDGIRRIYGAQLPLPQSLKSRKRHRDISKRKTNIPLLFTDLGNLIMRQSSSDDWGWNTYTEMEL